MLWSTCYVQTAISRPVRLLGWGSCAKMRKELSENRVQTNRQSLSEAVDEISTSTQREEAYIVAVLVVVVVFVCCLWEWYTCKS
ncbi:hypothetical protein LY78DRAFT_426311 [Colletotrichum sublineola]|nr:hypothetical protein LY78DRAFT_426311 [Colletotrichum sublineola]